MQEKNYEVYRGDTFAEEIVFTDTDGLAIDVTGWTVFFTVKKKKTDADADAVVKVTLSDDSFSFSSELGKVLVVVEASELDELEGLFYYDFQFKTLDGKVYTLLSGGITFVVDITRRITV